jgi:hypothetical protein
MAQNNDEKTLVHGGEVRISLRESINQDESASAKQNRKLGLRTVGKS